MATKADIEHITQRNVESIAKLEADFDNGRTFGERLADWVTAGVGSWTFLISQATFMLVWMSLNILGWWHRWDPQPFVLLNLILVVQAAFSTPMILMSENRQMRLSERRNHLDLQINLLAEQENSEQLRLLRLLCEKLDISLDQQDQEFLEESPRPHTITRQIVDTLESNERQPS